MAIITFIVNRDQVHICRDILQLFAELLSFVLPKTSDRTTQRRLTETMLIHTFPSFACKSVSPAVDLTISVVCIFATTLILWLAIYRLYFSPLARFPGPKLAALTTLYEFYHNGVHRVKFYSKIEELHKKYGMV